MISFRKGKIVFVDNKSGHYKPNAKSMKKVDKVLGELYVRNPNLFSNRSKWSQNNED